MAFYQDGATSSTKYAVQDMAGENDVVTRAILKDELETFGARIEDRTVDRMDSKLTALEDRIVEQMRGIETSLLKEFRKWALPMTYRVTALETHNERWP